MKPWLVSVIAVCVLAVIGVVGYIFIQLPPQPTQSGPFANSCGSRPSDVTVSAKELDLAGVKLFKVAIGKLQLKNEPTVSKVLSEGSRNSVVEEYLICMAEQRNEIDKNDLAQIQYLRDFFSILATNPNTEQLDGWQKAHPFPKRQSLLRLPDLVAEGDKKTVTFASNDLTKKIRFINAGESELHVWVGGFPEKVFYPDPDEGPWSIPPGKEQDLTIVRMYTRARNTKYPFVIEVAGGQRIYAEIKLTDLSPPKQYSALSSQIRNALSSAPPDKYQVALSYTSHVLNSTKTTNDFVTSQVLNKINEPDAALKALKNLAYHSTTSVTNPWYYRALGNTYQTLGDSALARQALDRSKSLALDLRLGGSSR